MDFRRASFLKLVLGCVGGLLVTAGSCQQDRCAFDSDCPADQFCTEVDGENLCASACDIGQPCAEGEACLAVSGGAACVPAETARIGEDCTENNDCASGACVLAGEGSVCVVLCDDAGGCPDPGRCYPVGLNKVCLTPTDDRGLGEACSSPLECESAICVGQGNEGASCVESCLTTSDCAGGALCGDLENGQRGCLRGLEDGENCITPDLCKSGRCIEDNDGTRLCTRACNDWLCDDTWSCVPSGSGDRICMPNTDNKASGEVCQSARECADPYCVGFGDLGVRCAPACEQGVLCADPLVCWVVDAQPDVCGP